MSSIDEAQGKRESVTLGMRVPKKRRMDEGISQETSDDYQPTTSHKAADYLQGLAAFLMDTQRGEDQSKQEVAKLRQQLAECGEKLEQVTAVREKQDEQITALEHEARIKQYQLEELDLAHQGHAIQMEENEKLLCELQKKEQECDKIKAELRRRSQECADAQNKLKARCRNDQKRQAVMEAALELVEGRDTLGKRMTKLEQMVKTFRG